MIHAIERLAPWYRGPDWPTGQELGGAWWVMGITIACIALACAYEGAAWRYGFHTISYLSQRTPTMRYAILAFILTAAIVACRLWWLHTDGSYGGQ